VNTAVTYGGDPSQYGQTNDPMVGGRIGGVNVFGGGLALYNWIKTLVWFIARDSDDTDGSLAQA